MTHTAATYARKEGISEDTARYRLNKLVKQGKAQTWIEMESVVTNVHYQSALPKKIRYYSIDNPNNL